MSLMQHCGIVPVGRMDDLSPLEATLICCLRLYYESDEARDALERSLLAQLGDDRGRSLFAQFGELCELTLRFCRRPLMRRHTGCCTAGVDEGAFAAMVAAAAAGDREDAMLIAVCLVRPEVSPPVVVLAEQVGLCLIPLVPAVTEREARRLH